MDWVSVFALGLAVSIDGLCAGLAYGMKRIKIPVLSLVVVSLASGVALGTSMLAGHSVSWLVEGCVPKAMGACMLLVMGLVMVWDAAKHSNGRSQTAGSHAVDDRSTCSGRPVEPCELPDVGSQEQEVGGGNSRLPCGTLCAGCPYLPSAAPAKTLKLKIGSLRLVIHVLREPEAADLDGSGVLSPAEAALLGTALALDAAGAGFASAVSGLWSLYVPVVVACMKFAAVSLGLKLGTSCSRALGRTPLAFAPGVCLILLALRSLI